MTTEKVLCIQTAHLPKSWTQKKVVLPLSMEEFISQCEHSRFSFLNRDQAEKDPSYKQIIPYLILQTLDGQQTATYLRKGSETRLHNLWSIGIGGHINPEDADLTTNQAPDQEIDAKPENFRGILIAGVQRELDEELTARPDDNFLQFEGIISENATEVGQVHLGAVFSLFTKTPEKYSPGPELSDFQWVSSDQLSRMNLELWSEMSRELFSLSPSFQQAPDNRVFLL